MAVASGMLPLAHGNDGGGSLRTPAACTGLVGLKPSRGRVSRGPDLGDSWLAADGVLTRTVFDTALALDVLGGYEVGDSTWAPRPAEPYALAMRRDPGKLRVTAANPLEVDVDPESLRGLRFAAELVSALGHEVEEAQPFYPDPSVLDIFLSVYGPLIALGVNHGVLLAGHEPTEDEIEPLHTRALRAGAADAVDRLPRRDRAAAGPGPRDRRVLRRLRRADHAGAGRAAAAASANAPGSASTRSRTSRAPDASRRSHRCST